MDRFPLFQLAYKEDCLKESKVTKSKNLWIWVKHLAQNYSFPDKNLKIILY